MFLERKCKSVKNDQTCEENVNTSELTETLDGSGAATCLNSSKMADTVKCTRTLQKMLVISDSFNKSPPTVHVRLMCKNAP
jgi:hypothetical protein